MAIRRCPYCKAIIDEQDKYCNNCGTQLLFPEDEHVEEDIPGDKIIEEEEESEEEPEEEPEEKAAKDEEELREEYEEGEEEEGTLGGDEAEEDGDKLESFENEEEDKEGKEEKETDKIQKLVERERDEAEEEGLEFVGEEKGESEELPQEEFGEGFKKHTPTGEVIEEAEAGPEERELRSWMELKDEIARKAQGEESEEQLQNSLEPAVEKPSAELGETGKKYEAAIEEDELVFKTKELDRLTRTVEEGKKELEGLLSSFEGEKAEKKEPTSGTKEGLPPWVSGMKEESPAVTPDQEDESREAPSPTRREWATDSGIGIPERVTQTTLPFSDTMARKEAHKEPEKEKEEGQVEEGVEEREARSPTGFSLKLKAKFVDLVFITALWLISLGFASGVLGVSFFKIVFVAPLPVLAFYLILLLLYFFLFLYFLGETLGDHYFSEED
jgi:hypothetical protein